MRSVAVALLLPMLLLGACDYYDDPLMTVGGTPAAPEALEASYFAGAVVVYWELGRSWNGEAFRIYSRRISDFDFFLIAEVTNCLDSVCSYEDWNIISNETYEYYVTAIDWDSGIETATDRTVQVAIPDQNPPPVPLGTLVVTLDNANYLMWDSNARISEDFSHYRVYQDSGDGGLILGETDSEGFLDLLAVNGTTYEYFVTSFDTGGHESLGSNRASGTPRPDFHDEWISAFSDNPDQSGFRFQVNDITNPVVDGSDPARHFRLESDGAQWWIVPGPGASIFPSGFPTTALKCGVAADARCTDISVAPSGAYVTTPLEALDETSYVMDVIGEDGLQHFGVLRAKSLGFNQSGHSIMIFSWAYQLLANNDELGLPPDA